MSEAIFGFLGVIVGALINRWASIKAQRVAADANIRHLMYVKAHDAIIVAIKSLTYRNNLCDSLVKIVTNEQSEEKIRLNTVLTFNMLQKYADTSDTDMEVLAVTPYLRSVIPARGPSEVSDANILLNFTKTCREINKALTLRGPNSKLMPSEINELYEALQRSKDAIKRESDHLVKILDILYKELNRPDLGVFAEKENSKKQINS